MIFSFLNIGCFFFYFRFHVKMFSVVLNLPDDDLWQRLKLVVVYRLYNTRSQYYLYQIADYLPRIWPVPTKQILCGKIFDITNEQQQWNGQQINKYNYRDMKLNNTIEIKIQWEESKDERKRELGSYSEMTTMWTYIIGLSKFISIYEYLVSTFSTILDHPNIWECHTNYFIIHYVLKFNIT